MKGKILIAENENRMRTLIKLYLENNMYKVLEASDGQETLYLLSQEQPDLLVLDILMPKLTGIEVCETIRKDPIYQNVPILFLSSLNEKESVIKGLEVGGDDYLTKPFDPNELVARINAMLRRLRKSVEDNQETFMYEELTSQEMKILLLMEKGYTNKEIASKLFLTEGTVKVYNHHIYQKLQVKNRTQAIVRAKEVALI